MVYVNQTEIESFEISSGNKYKKEASDFDSQTHFRIIRIDRIMTIMKSDIIHDRNS